MLIGHLTLYIYSALIDASDLFHSGHQNYDRKRYPWQYVAIKRCFYLSQTFHWSAAQKNVVLLFTLKYIFNSLLPFSKHWSNFDYNNSAFLSAFLYNSIESFVIYILVRTAHILTNAFQLWPVQRLYKGSVIQGLILLLFCIVLWNCVPVL